MNGISSAMSRSTSHYQLYVDSNDDVIPLCRQSIEDYLWIIRQLPLEYSLATPVADS